MNGREDTETAKRQSSKINLYSAISIFFPTYSYLKTNKQINSKTNKQTNPIINGVFCT